MLQYTTTWRAAVARLASGDRPQPNSRLKPLASTTAGASAEGRPRVTPSFDDLRWRREPPSSRPFMDRSRVRQTDLIQMDLVGFEVILEHPARHGNGARFAQHLHAHGPFHAANGKRSARALIAHVDGE